MLRSPVHAPPWLARRTLATQAAAYTGYKPYPLLEHTIARNGTSQRDKIPIFSISKARGFLPRDDPLATLPAVFDPLDSLLKRMTIEQPGGRKGLLAYGQLGHAVKSELKPAAIERHVVRAIETGDQVLISALFRDYCFLASAFLLEPVDLHFRATGTYTTGRDILPAEIAVPLKQLADALGHFPYMEYASSYALQNWTRKDPNGGIVYDNLRLIRAFEDPTGSEAGFILVHVDMVAHSGDLVEAAEDAMTAVATKERGAFNNVLWRLYSTYQKIQLSMDTMWSRSLPSDYLKFRSFIFGTAPGNRLNSMFPNGVIYENVSDEPLYFRGESGANDSMIPLGDNLLEITKSLPDNGLTKVLREFRAYRPGPQRQYIQSVEERATALGVKNFAEMDTRSLALYVLCVDQIREFRERHWRFTKTYIIKNSSYDLATGGSPILSYLPQNLRTVLVVQEEAVSHLTPTAMHLAGLEEDLIERVEKCRANATIQRKLLDREVRTLQEQHSHRAEKADLGEEKILQRGWVGNDGVG
ncbi:hypothetical protein PUNSTDRAFT_100537 [Punctularia strigosozonata HHB-11173 SS5]|uniref:uncharacterized protein n=1 Tax=Punctularia strigosozonata (strain HHB-11173) TaxID=741275 RepID=UPI0004416AE1|nr:uncharacterized protein PUNSTDRAFT_100537 [Punctularia strigosozonata HHB-11173 SS5]EIN10769.1 hypothetical protein PUNSTDRAFT_100537 [Punctularia strigosozonata HHB-11173 SS5]